MSQRKLLQEIDKVFKKVKEGLEIFDGYYEKLMNCESQSQKEKLEGDLKREIKKLQRQRDQIKNWLSGNEVKDKNLLLENRRLIENAMERFKVVEKNMKTKAFSKEGLSMERIDPKEKEKQDTAEFLHQMLEELERQCEKHEAIIDQLQSSVKKGKKLDFSKQGEVDELEEKLERNHWHISKLEQIARLLENDDLECDQVNGLQDDIKYFVESNEDVEFMEDDTIYDELGLPDADEAYGNIGDFPGANQEEGEEQEETTSNNTPKKPSISALPAPQPSTTAVPTTNNASTTSLNHATPQLSTTKPLGLQQGLTPVLSSASLTTVNLKPSIALKPELKYSSVVSAGVSSSNHGTPSLSSAQLSNFSNTNLNNVSSAIETPKFAQSSVDFSSIARNEITVEPTEEPQEEEQDEQDVNGGEDAEEKQEYGTKDPSSILADLIPNFEKLKQHISKPVAFEDISKVLETSLLNCPDSFDSEKPKHYLPEIPHPTSIHYPQEPTPELSYPSILSKLDLSTLFFNFYYRQNEYIQILSARELVKKGWKYDKISSKWYQKIEEIQPQPPNLVNDQAISIEKKTAWKYFDNEGVWLPRRKEDFDINAVDLETSF